MTLHLPIGSLTTRLGWSRYRDANPVPTSPLADDITTAPSGPVFGIKRGQVLYTCLHQEFTPPIDNAHASTEFDSAINLREMNKGHKL